MAHSANSHSSSTKTTDDFDITKFPEIDRAFIASIWNAEQKNEQGSNCKRLTRLIRSIDADVSTPNEGLDSFTYSEVSSSISVGEQVDDDPNSSSPSGIELYVDLTSYSTINEIVKRIDARNPKEKAVEVKRQGNENRREQNLKIGRQRKK